MLRALGSWVERGGEARVQVQKESTFSSYAYAITMRVSSGGFWPAQKACGLVAGVPAEPRCALARCPPPLACLHCSELCAGVVQSVAKPTTAPGANPTNRDTQLCARRLARRSSGP